MSYIQANTNGRLHSAAEPSIAPLDRGFLYGDAIYEVWRTYHGVVFAWEEHWTRLQKSANALYFPVFCEKNVMLGEIKKTVEAFCKGGGPTEPIYIRAQITRGAGAIGLDTALAQKTDYVLLVQPCPAASCEQLRNGLRLSLATGLRRNPAEALNPAWKTGNYLNNLLCLREARSRGADEVVILNLAGEVTEAAVSNIAFVRDGRVLTPPLTAGILPGITRGLLLQEIAQRAGVSMAEATIRPEDISAMEECFLMSTTKDVMPVAVIDGVRFTVGESTVTTKLKAAFAAYAQEYAAQHPELRVIQ